MPRQAPVITCGCGCGRRGRHQGRRLVEACWIRAKRAGTLDRYPRVTPIPQSRPMRLVATSVQGRLEDYVEMTRDWGLSKAHAADRLGITLRTATRYESHLRATTPQEESTAA